MLRNIHIKHILELFYQPITKVDMNTEMQKYYFLIRNSFSTFVKFFPSDTSTSEGILLKYRTPTFAISVRERERVW